MSTLDRLHLSARRTVAALALLLAAAASRPVLAVFPNNYPLRDLLRESQWIAEAKVTRHDPEMKRFVVEAAKDLRGKLPFRRLNVNLGAAKDDEAGKLLKRLRAGMPLAVFALRKDASTTFLCYGEGTWFSLTSRTPPPAPAPGAEGGKPAAEAPPEPAAAACGLEALEPNLRRTFAGSTRELLLLLPEVLAGRKKAPPPNPGEPPGLGPEVQAPPPPGKE
jgi:hypothetical protein